jgi:DNA-binding transcriptional LysR family regulator
MQGMKSGVAFDKIDLSLIRAFHTVITERSVSRAALRLSTSQPAVSGQLKRLRGLIGDPLLVRAGAGMAPTAVALSLLPAAAQVLQGAQLLFGGLAATQVFAPQAAEQTFRIAVSDYLDPLFLPELVARVRAPGARRALDLMPLTREYDYRGHLARGEVDLVIGNWLRRRPSCTWAGWSATSWCAWWPPPPGGAAAAGRWKLPGQRAHRAHAAACPGGAGRDRRAPAGAGPAAPHRGAQRRTSG